MYNSGTRSFQNQPGLGIKVSGFGDTCKVEYLAANPIETDCSLQLPLGAYFSTMVKHYTGLGYKRGTTIRAAPYDWRLSPGMKYSDYGHMMSPQYCLFSHSLAELQANGYYANVKSLIQTMYAAGGNKKVTIVAHSMGGPVSLYFLNNVVTQQWKNTYINAFIPIAGAWSGGGLVLKLLISGYAPNELLQIDDICQFPSNLDILFRNAARTFPSTALLLPKPSVWENTVLVTTPKRSYTANDYAALYTDIGYPQGYSIYTGITAINAGFPAPNVPVYCFYGTGVQTSQKFIYDNGFPNTAPRIVNGDGDGTVNLLSSQVCLSWKSQTSPFTSRTFPGANHVGILKSSAVLSAIDAVVLNV